MTEKKTAEKKSEVSGAFKLFHATSVNGGAMMIAAVIASYMSQYLTDTIQIPAKVLSLVMFIAFVWDAVNDPIMGIVADRTHTKFGRYRPYFLAAPVLLTLFSTLIWVDWGFTSTTAKAVYILIVYIGYGMTVTMYTMPQMAILPAAVRSDKERNSIITLGAASMAIMFTIGNTFTTNITGFFQKIGFSNGYIPLMLGGGLLAFISFWGLFAASKGQERYLMPATKQKIWKELGGVLKYKEIWPNIVAWMMASIGYGLMFSSSVYYMMYYYTRPDQIGIYMGVETVKVFL